MVFGKTKLELKVGLFVFAGMVILITFILLIGDFKTWGSGHRVKFMFNFVNGIKLGAPVRFAGVDVGEVKDISFVFSPEEQRMKVELACLLKQQANIPVDSKVWINTLGLLGEKYVDIVPGKDFTEFLGETHVIKGNDPLAMHEVGEAAMSVVNNLNETIAKIKNKEGTLGKLIYDEALYKQIEAIGSDLQALLKQTDGLVEDIRRNPWKLLWKAKTK
ncbi:MAG: MlaD family protein [Candidatus Omnitrophota bacterium]|jgi:phospholipid/cholesterol/gamma-HCH transport system substrate-binding protein